MNPIIITTQLTLSDYKKAQLFLFYRKIGIKFALAMGIILLAISLFTFILMIVNLVIYGIYPESIDQTPIVPLFFGLGMSVFPYYAVLRNAKKNYESYSLIRESINYQFEDEKIEITGESFHTSLSWDKFYAFTVSKDFVLLWQSNLTTNVIPKRYLTQEQIVILKNIADKYPSVKKKN